MSSAECYRRGAVECQRQADAATTESVRETLHDIADKYLALAANEDRSSTMLDVAAKCRPPQSPDARG